MKEIIEKLKERRDKELIISIFNELTTSLRHLENIIIALPTILATLFALLKMLEIELKLPIVFFSFLGLLVGTKIYFNYSKQEKLLKELIDIIAEDPMDEKDLEVLKDTFHWLLFIIAMFMLQLLIIFS